MDITVQNEKKMSLLGRTDYTVRVAHQSATPDRASITSAISKQLKAKDELVMVRAIRPDFGSSSSIVEVSVYDSKEKLDQFESGYVKTRHEKANSKVVEAKAAADAKAAEEAAAAKETAEETPSEEAPAEEPVEETPAETVEESPAEEKSEESPAEEPAEEPSEKKGDAE